MKKTFLAGILFLACALRLPAQTWQDQVKDPSDFYDIQKAFNQHLSEEGLTRSGYLSADDEEAKFRRWEWFMEPRVFPSGKIPSRDVLLKEMTAYQMAHQHKTSAANWTSLEPPTGYPANGFAGRVNCIAFHPLDSNILFAGMPAGGLWKSSDGGQTWTPKTDNLPSLGVSEIVINPQNPNIMYMATGDKDAANFISNPYSYGLLKSIDGGNTWDTTGLKFPMSSQITIQRLLIHPTKPSYLYAAVSGVGNERGIWRSKDAGATWVKPYGGAKYDMEFNPANPSIIYASAYTYLLRSLDTGATWTIISSGNLPSSGVTSAKIAVTPAQPNLVYVQFLASSGNTYGLYKSSDAGATWSQRNLYVLTTQGGYDWVLAASPLDSNMVFYGGQSMMRSTDGGTTTGFLNPAHPDHHGLDYRPGSKTLYLSGDGGIYRSFTNGNTWTSLNKGFATFQYYRLGSSVTSPGMILTGAQDNGTWRHNTTNWTMLGWGDGMECLVDYTDSNIYYTCTQNGSLTRWGTGLGVFTSPPNAGSTSYCAWTTPYIIHPNDPKTLYYGGKDIYRTVNRCNSWTSYSTNLTIADNVGGGILRWMAISESKPDSVLYASSYVVVYRTTNGGTTWSNVTSNLPASAGCYNCAAITSVTVHPSNPNIVWATLSGFVAGTKVFKTTNGGASWTNYSGTLPNIPVNCLVFEKNNKEQIYIGTDVGVYYRDSSMTDWQPYMTGLPNVPVQEMEIHYGTGKLRAATFGRGLWETRLNGITTGMNVGQNEDEQLIVSPNPSTGIFDLSLETGEASDIALKVYDISGRIVLQNKERSLSGHFAERINIGNYPQGIYLLELKTGEKVFRKKLVKY